MSEKHLGPDLPSVSGVCGSCVQLSVDLETTSEHGNRNIEASCSYENGVEGQLCFKPVQL